MARAVLQLKLPGEEARSFDVGRGASIGRASDNSICIPDHSVSRYHAVIERRGDGYWLKDLGSVNGTYINGAAISAETELVDKSEFSPGGIVSLAFRVEGGVPDSGPPHPIAPAARETSRKRDAPSSIAAPGAGGASPVSPGAAPRPVASRVKYRNIAITAVLGVAVLAAGIALLVSRLGASAAGVVRISSPQNGDTVRGPVTVRTQTTGASSIERVIYQLDSVEFATVEVFPYDLRLDPVEMSHKFPNLRQGTHVLSLVVQDQNGNRAVQPDTVTLSFSAAGPEAAASVKADTGGSAASGGASDGPASGAAPDIALLAPGLAGEISQKSGYVFEPEMVDLIRGRSGDYLTDATDEARRYRREIIKAFRDKGLPPLLGFVLALSETRFQPGQSNGSATVGLWGIPIEIAKGYLAASEDESVFRDPQRSAEIAAAYVKDLVDVFGMDDFMYAIACFGKPLPEAGQLRTKIEQAAGSSPSDFWAMVRSGVVPREQADHVIRFLAAGIVGENPRRFGLNSDPLSSLILG